MIRWAIDAMERGWIPDSLTRLGIRHLLRRRLQTLERGAEAEQQNVFAQLHEGPIALHTGAANQQHYELPAAFFQLVLGAHLKYSSCLWSPGVDDLSAAEAAMLDLSCKHAQLEDGMEILELGCGWGSLSLWMAQHYPRSRVLAMSNSQPQRQWIEAQCSVRNLHNLAVVTADINAFQPGRRFDRIVSIEMFEHLRNYRELFRRLHPWLAPGGKLFVHVFSHQRFSYFFETEGDDDWMGRYFFTGGTMPSHDLLPRLAEGFKLEDAWRIGGRHYQRTLEAWLALQDRRRHEIMPILTETYHAEAKRWFQRWRVFFMACSELFGYRDGNEWGVSHYRLVRR